MVQETEVPEIELPLKVAYADVPYAATGAEREDKDFFEWDPEALGSTEEPSDDMLVWLAC